MRILRDVMEALNLAKAAKDLFGEVFGQKLPPHVVRLPDGRMTTEPGYVFSSADPDDTSVHWVAGWVWAEMNLVAGQAAGKWGPCEGYMWIDPAAPDCLKVRWVPGRRHSGAPHVFAATEERTWMHDQGFRWVCTDRNDLRVEPVPAHAASSLKRFKDLGALGLDEGATVADVESAFRELAKVHHPDRFAGQGEAAMAEAGRRFLRLREARDRLLAGGEA